MTSPGKHQALFERSFSIHGKRKAAFPIERSESRLTALGVGAPRSAQTGPCRLPQREAALCPTCRKQNECDIVSSWIETACSNKIEIKNVSPFGGAEGTTPHMRTFMPTLVSNKKNLFDRGNHMLDPAIVRLARVAGQMQGEAADLNRRIKAGQKRMRVLIEPVLG